MAKKIWGVGNRIVLPPMFLLLLAFMAIRCAALFSGTPRYDVTGIYPELKTNGVVIRIVSLEKLDKVEAWIGEDNWLYITIPDTSLDFNQLSRLEMSPAIEQAKLFKYSASVQVTLQLRKRFDQVEVVRYPRDRNVYVVLRDTLS